MIVDSLKGDKELRRFCIQNILYNNVSEKDVLLLDSYIGKLKKPTIVHFYMSNYEMFQEDYEKEEIIEKKKRNHKLFSRFVKELEEKKIYVYDEFMGEEGDLIDFFSMLYMIEDEIEDYFGKLKKIKVGNNVVIRFWDEKTNILDEKTKVRDYEDLFVKFDEENIRKRLSEVGFSVKELKQDSDFIVVEATKSS
jgi:hypothetical protein